MIDDVKMFKNNHVEQGVAVEWCACKVLNILWSIIWYRPWESESDLYGIITMSYFKDLIKTPAKKLGKSHARNKKLRHFDCPLRQ